VRNCQSTKLYCSVISPLIIIAYKFSQSGLARGSDLFQKFQSIICPPVNDMHTNRIVHVVLGVKNTRDYRRLLGDYRKLQPKLQEV
jgi:hypothetical protein